MASSKNVDGDGPDVEQQSLRRMMDALENKFTAKFSEVQVELSLSKGERDAMEIKFNEVHKELNCMEIKFNESKVELVVVEVKFSGVKEELSLSKGERDAMEVKFNQVQEGVKEELSLSKGERDAMEIKFNESKVERDAMEVKFNQVQDELSAVEGRLGTVETELDIMKYALASRQYATSYENKLIKHVFGAEVSKPTTKPYSFRSFQAAADFLAAWQQYKVQGASKDALAQFERAAKDITTGQPAVEHFLGLTPAKREAVYERWNAVHLAKPNTTTYITEAKRLGNKQAHKLGLQVDEVIRKLIELNMPTISNALSNLRDTLQFP